MERTRWWNVCLTHSRTRVPSPTPSWGWGITKKGKRKGRSSAQLPARLGVRYGVLETLKRDKDEGFLMLDCPYKGFCTAQDRKSGPPQGTSISKGSATLRDKAATDKNCGKSSNACSQVRKSSSCLLTCSASDWCHPFASE